MAAATDIGPVRQENQDAFAATALARGGTGMLVADGMGGHAGGAEAAQAASAEAIASLAGGGVDGPTAAQAVVAATSGVAAVRSRLGGQPGTTLTLAVLDGQRAVVAHVGDSRAYLVRGAVASVITDDHSWVGEQVRAGALSADAMRTDPRRNIVTLAVMGDAVPEQLVELELSPGDTLLLCTDGMWGSLADDQIAELVSTPGPLTAVVGRAVEAALAAGATDNVTAVAARIGD